MKFLSPEVALYPYKSTIRPCMEQRCHVWAVALSCYLEVLDKLQKRISRADGPLLAASLTGITLLDVRLNWLKWFDFSNYYSDRLDDFSVIISRCYKDVYVNSFFPRTAILWNSPPIECFPLIYDINGFKSRINMHLLNAGCF